MKKLRVVFLWVFLAVGSLALRAEEPAPGVYVILDGSGSATQFHAPVFSVWASE